MTLEVSSVTGTQNIGGIKQPTIGQRRIDLELRLRDGEVNLVGEILDDTETQSLSGYALLSRIPILKYFFAPIDKQRQEDEIIFAITPHIVRSQELTDKNLRLVDLGAGAPVSVATDHHETAPAAAPLRNSPQSPSLPGPTRPNRPPEPAKSSTPSSSVQPVNSPTIPPSVDGSFEPHAPT